MDEQPKAGNYILIVDLAPDIGGASYFFGDLVYLTAKQATRMVGSGTVVSPDSEDGQMILAGVEKIEAKRRILAKRQRPHIVHRASENLQASPQPQREQEPVLDPDDSEALDRTYAQGPDWTAIRGRQNQPLPPRGPKADE